MDMDMGCVLRISLKFEIYWISALSLLSYKSSQVHIAELFLDLML